MPGGFGDNITDVVMGGPPSVGSECCLPTCTGLACLACGFTGGVYFERDRNEVPRKGVTDGVREGRLVVIQGEQRATGAAGVKIIDKGLYNSLWDWCCNNPAYEIGNANYDELVEELEIECKKKLERKHQKKFENLVIRKTNKISIEPAPLTAEQLIERLKTIILKQKDWGKIISLITEHINDIGIDDILKILNVIFNNKKLKTENKIDLLIKIIESMEEGDITKALKYDKFYNFILEVLLKDEFLHRKKKKQTKPIEDVNFEEEEEPEEEEEEQPGELLDFFIKIFPMMIEKMNTEKLNKIGPANIDRLLLLLMEYYNTENIALPKEDGGKSDKVSIINIDKAPEGKNETIKFDFLFKLIKYYNEREALPDVSNDQLEALFEFVKKIIGKQKEDLEPKKNDKEPKPDKNDEEKQKKLSIMQDFASSIAARLGADNWNGKVKQEKQQEINFPRSEPTKPPVSNEKLKVDFIESHNIDMSLPAEKPKEKSKVTELKINKGDEIMLAGKEDKNEERTVEKKITTNESIINSNGGLTYGGKDYNYEPESTGNPCETNILIKRKSNHNDYIVYKSAKEKMVVEIENIDQKQLGYRFPPGHMQPPIISEYDEQETHKIEPYDWNKKKDNEQPEINKIKMTIKEFNEKTSKYAYSGEFKDISNQKSEYTINKDNKHKNLTSNNTFGTNP